MGEFMNFWENQCFVVKGDDDYFGAGGKVKSFMYVCNEITDFSSEEADKWNRENPWSSGVMPYDEYWDDYDDWDEETDDEWDGVDYPWDSGRIPYDAYWGFGEDEWTNPRRVRVQKTGNTIV